MTIINLTISAPTQRRVRSRPGTIFLATPLVACAFARGF
jgi:hypothetical protein